VDQMNENQQRFIKGLQKAWLVEQSSQRIYKALASSEKSPARRRVLLKLAESEMEHGDRWARRLQELGAKVPVYRPTLRDRLWHWTLVQSGTDNALKRIESTEDEGAELYGSLAVIAPARQTALPFMPCRTKKKCTAVSCIKSPKTLQPV